MKKLVYVGHEYHKKTKSVDFLLDLLSQRYDVTYTTFDGESNEIKGKETGFTGTYDVLVLFQMPVKVELLREQFKFRHGVYIPMYDGTGEAPNEFWLDYKDFNIINFSETLHKRLLNMGFSSYYIQYFPEPAQELVKGKNDTVFFWQRRSNININTVCSLLEQTEIKNIHIHKAVDPGEIYIEPDEKKKKHFNFSYSAWYADKEDMLRDMKNASVYVAPREYEGIGMSFLEAMAMGKCVIAPNHPTMNEYIQHGYNGYLYDIYKVNAIQIDDLERIQKNTYEYMKKGYEKWEKNKYSILEWLEKEVNINQEFLENTYKEKYVIHKFYIGKKLLLTKEAGNTYRLFGKIKLGKRMEKVICVAGNIKYKLCHR